MKEYIFPFEKLDVWQMAVDLTGTVFNLFEVLTLNEVFRRRRLLNDEGASEIRQCREQIDRKLNGLINSLQGRRVRKPAGQMES